MNQSEFDVILERRLSITRELLAAKGKEYKEVGKRDRLHNFNRGADMEKTTREKYLRSLWLKHLVLLFDIIDDWQEEKVTTDIIDEKIGDSVSYLILLEAMLKEDIDAAGRTLFKDTFDPKYTVEEIKEAANLKFKPSAVPGEETNHGFGPIHDEECRKTGKFIT
jgi:hypothetical protein